VSHLKLLNFTHTAFKNIMEQLFAAFGVNWKLLIGQAVNFGLLLSLLTYLLYKPLLRIIDERREKVAEGVRTAQEAARTLADAKTESEGIVGTAAREAETLVATARARADEKGGEIVKAAETRADGVMKDAAARAEEAKRNAMQESAKDIARAAMLAAEKVLREKSA
jgi:F-type H+-transporting ATPase subunit b